MKRPLAFAFVLALSTVPTCASLPAPADGTFVERVNLPAFPTSVPSTFGPVPVKLVRRLDRCGGERNPALVYYGCFHYGPPRFIEIEDTLSAVMRWRTLTHEMVHLALALDGAKLSDPDEENRVAEAIAKQETHAMLMGWPR
jgi:hypothetical protein